jgi:four helix bundle protein
MDNSTSIIYNKSYVLALEIIKVFGLHQGNIVRDIFRQLLRCGTSVGANLAEANGAISEAEFSAKVSIAYKEALETKYWVSLLKDGGYIDENTYVSLFTKADEICKMAFSILKSSGRIKNKM